MSYFSIDVEQLFSRIVFDLGLKTSFDFAKNCVGRGLIGICSCCWDWEKLSGQLSLFSSLTMNSALMSMTIGIGGGATTGTNMFGDGGGEDGGGGGIMQGGGEGGGGGDGILMY